MMSFLSISGSVFLNKASCNCEGDDGQLLNQIIASRWKCYEEFYSL